jgi:hypothetical protein
VPLAAAGDAGARSLAVAENVPECVYVVFEVKPSSYESGGTHSQCRQQKCFLPVSSFFRLSFSPLLTSSQFNPFEERKRLDIMLHRAF